MNVTCMGKYSCIQGCVLYERNGFGFTGVSAIISNALIFEELASSTTLLHL